jgi:general secretion pathway protein K
MSTNSRRGSALLAVLWLSAALAAIGFAMANTVRGETERTATEIDGLRSYYLAAGAVERAALELLWSVSDPEHRMLPLNAISTTLHFASGDAQVEILPEAGKLDVNRASPEVLYRLGVALGIEPGRAGEIATGIAAYRGTAGASSGASPGLPSLVPPSGGSSFRPRHASLQEIEELLQVRGVTPDILYGTFVPAEGAAAASGAPDRQGAPSEAPAALLWKPGLADCLSVFGSSTAVDINTAQPAVLMAAGASPGAVMAILQRRRQSPIAEGELPGFLGSLGLQPGGFRVGGYSIATIRAVARVRQPNGQLSDLRRTVGAMFKYMPAGYDSPLHILRWYDTAWSY